MPAAETAALIAAAISATATAGSATASGVTSTSEKGFKVGATIENKTPYDFEVRYYDEIRGAWGTAPTTELLGSGTILKSVLHEKEVEAGKTAIEDYWADSQIEKQFAKTTLYVSGTTRGTGFKGVLLLFNQEYDISILLYIGKPANVGFRAGATIGQYSGNSKLKRFDKHTAEYFEDRWRDKVGAIRTPSTFSTGASQTSVYVSSSDMISVSYHATERFNFEITSLWEDNFNEFATQSRPFKFHHSHFGRPKYAIYIVVNDQVRWIQDGETLHNLDVLGFSNEAATPKWTTNVSLNYYDHLFRNFPEGPPIPSLKDGNLYKGTGRRKIFIMENLKKRWITGAALFKTLGLEWGDVQTISAEDIDRIPTGDDVNASSQLALTAA